MLSSTCPRLTLCAALVVAAAAQAEPARFTRDVVAALSKGGCNQGACHGNLNGKGGFRLSLRGQDPAFDLAALTRDSLGRRVDVQRPDDSLILQKAAATMPHEGGRRYGPESPAFQVLRQWIAEGARPDPAGAAAVVGLDVRPGREVLVEPADRVRVSVTARFADGSSRDVSALSVFESTNPAAADVDADGTVRRTGFGESTVTVRYLDRQAPVRVAFVPQRPGFVWPNPPERNFIDKLVFAKLKELRQLPAELAPDHVFLRRVHLDTLGVLPDIGQTRAFLTDTSPDKRDRLIDALLERPEFADYWALKWADLLRAEEKTLDRKGVQAVQLWLRQAIAAGKPLNETARELLAGRGSTYANAPANFYRALREPAARAEAAAQVFLGVRIGCAKCHNHPFDQWTMDDYYSTVAFFPRVQYRLPTNTRRDRLDKHEFNGEQFVWLDREGETTNPRTNSPIAPKFLGTGRSPDNSTDRLTALADWVADPDNPFFARAQANRVWYHLTGRGLVEPDDDFRASNPPTNPELLDALAAELKAYNFDLKHLVRTVLRSRTYQLSAAPDGAAGGDEANYAHARVMQLEAEQLLDALGKVTGRPVKFSNQPGGVRAGQLPGVQGQLGKGVRPGMGERFLKAFGKPDRLLSCDCERSDETTLIQAFQLITGGMLNDMLSDPENRIGKMLDAGKDDAHIVKELYLAALSRRATGDELCAAARVIARGPDRRAALEDVLWGVVNSKEFLLRH